MIIVALVILVVLISLGLVGTIHNKRLYKAINKIDSIHYNITRFGKLSKEKNDLICAYYQIRPETYKKIKSEPGSSIGFDIKFAYVPIARVAVASPENNLMAVKDVYAWELRHDKIKDSSLELMRMVQSKELPSENGIILSLKWELEQMIEQQNILQNLE